MTLALGPFQLERPLGRGGSGEVWSARPRGDGRRVAVKVMTAYRARDPDFVTAFRNEVRAVARLDHPNIVRVFDYGTIDETAERQLGGSLP
jgi:serine/threonine-protein kinase